VNKRRAASLFKTMSPFFIDVNSAVKTLSGIALLSDPESSNPGAATEGLADTAESTNESGASPATQ
jgi:hypothetical protein